jgi:hypothetical protein
MDLWGSVGFVRCLCRLSNRVHETYYLPSKSTKRKETRLV